MKKCNFRVIIENRLKAVFFCLKIHFFTFENLDHTFNLTATHLPSLPAGEPQPVPYHSPINASV